MHIGRFKKCLTYSYLKKKKKISFISFNIIFQCAQEFPTFSNGKRWNQLDVAFNKNLSLFYCELFFITDVHSYLVVLLPLVRTFFANFFFFLKRLFCLFGVVCFLISVDKKRRKIAQNYAFEKNW